MNHRKEGRNQPPGELERTRGPRAGKREPREVTGTLCGQVERGAPGRGLWVWARVEGFGGWAEGKPESGEDNGEAEEDAPSLGQGRPIERSDAQAGLPPGSTHEAEVTAPGRGVLCSWGHKERLLAVRLGLRPPGEPSACPQAGPMLGPPPGIQTVPPWRPRSPSSWNSAAHSTDAQK